MNQALGESKQGGAWLAAITGGLVGSLLTLVLLWAMLPQISGRIVRAGMLNDPQILPDTVDALRDSQYSPVLAANRASLETPFASSWRGAAKPAVTIVEFFDYACPYCKASNPVVDKLLAENKDVRIVYRELPILGADSVTSARLSLAASQAGRFVQFHDALYAAGRPAPETNNVAARAAGVAPQPKDDPLIEAELKKNFQLAGQLGATGTPLFVIGDRVLNGAVGYDTLKDAIDRARSKKG